LVIRFDESPLGALLTGCTDGGVCLLHFLDSLRQEALPERLAARFQLPVVPGEHPWLTRLGEELAEYFQGRRRDFTVPLASQGTSFQEQVWAALRQIPFGETISYEALARRVERPTAQRAVARANAQNQIAILIPCHRVIGKDGTLTGYGGGVWRKRLLLELERTGRLPGTG
jgi:AraC family transcriptional regulator of adaptative response/methylated-DNA-[protein]-cysteine methyltransferase